MKSFFERRRSRSDFLSLGRNGFRQISDHSEQSALTPTPGNGGPAPQGDANIDRYVNPVNQFRWEGKYGLVLGDTLNDASDLVKWITTTGAKILHVPDVHSLMPWLALYRDSYDFLLLEADNFNDADDVEEFELELRMLAPDLALIIAPSLEPRSFASELTATCDVMLKHPVSRLALLVGIDVAMEMRRNSFPNT